MISTSYVILVSTLKQDIEVMLKILNTAGLGHAFYGESGSTGSKELWIILKGKKNKQEVAALLQVMPAIRSVLVVALSKPVKESELTEVRKLFTSIGWDTRNVTNNELSLFIDAKLQGQYTYYIDYDHKEEGEGAIKIRIRPSQEHTHFSPDWLTEKDNEEEEIVDSELTIDDFEIRSVVVESAAGGPLPPPPSPSK